MFQTVLIGTAANANGVFDAQVNAGPVDAILIRTTGGAGGLAAYGDARITVRYFNSNGNAVSQFENFSFEAARGCLQAADYDPNADYGFIPLGRYNIDGAERLQIIVTWPTKNVANATFEAYRCFEDVDAPDGMHTHAVCQAVEAGTDSLLPLVDNLQEVYMLGTWTKFMSDNGVRQIETTPALSNVFTSRGIEGTPIMTRVYNAGMLEAMSRQGLRFTVTGATAGAQILMFGSKPDLDAIAKSARSVVRVRAEKLERAASAAPVAVQAVAAQDQIKMGIQPNIKTGGTKAAQGILRDSASSF